MIALLYPLKWLALAGFIASMAVHAIGLLQLPVPLALQPAIATVAQEWLGLGIFVVWMPTVLLASRIQGAYGVGGFSWNKLLAGCPPWLKNGIYGLFAYAFVNFFLTIFALETGTAETHFMQAEQVFSGHWMLFYGAAFATMHSVTRKPALLEASQCVAGHAVGLEHRFCPQCGQPLRRDVPDA